MNDPIRWQCRQFSQLTAHGLYQVLQARSAVFVVEQQCIYQDADGIDEQCYHLCGYSGEALAAYARLIPPGIVYPCASIGRVLTTAPFRALGAGKALLQTSIQQCRELFGEGSIRIGAQLYLERFYNGFGFERNGDAYLEDGIEHIPMIRPAG